MSKIIAVTGLPPQKLRLGCYEDHPAFIALKERLRGTLTHFIENMHIYSFICGMSLGIDQLAAQIIIELRESYPDIQLKAALPCIGVEKLWPQKAQDNFFKLLSHCDEVYFCTEGRYTKECMQLRNKYMVDKADYILAVWDGRPSGTANTVRYAKEQGKIIFLLDPNRTGFVIDSTGTETGY